MRYGTFNAKLPMFRNENSQRYQSALRNYRRLYDSECNLNSALTEHRAGAKEAF